MTRSDSRAALTEEVARFEAEILQVAQAIVRTLLSQELDRKLATSRPSRPRAGKPGRPKAAVGAPATATPEPSPEPPSAEPGAAGAREQPPGPPSGGRKRVRWTRESIVDELATWMKSGTALDATFVARHGPPGLVAATRRIFGRFEAALNVAALHLSKLYPDGPPER